MPSPAPVSGSIGKRYWVVLVVIGILARSLLLSFEFASGRFAASAWSTLISGVQGSSLGGGSAFFLWRARGRDRPG